MVSTYINYNLVTRDMKNSLSRIAQDTLVAREAAYYKENIGNITSVEDFLDDYRLYSYAMKAHGLEDMTYAKAFMKKVLESDLSDDNSYANLLTDDRYRNFASSFSFSESTAVVQTEAQEDAVIGLYSQSLANADDAVRSDTAYFNAMIDKVTNVDQLWGNERLRNYVYQAFGLESRYTSYTHFKAVVTSDVSDPNSYVNVTAKAYKDDLLAKINSTAAAASPADLANPNSLPSKLIATYQSYIMNAPDFVPLAAAFNFLDDGTLAPGDVPMSNANKAMTNESYVFQNPRATKSAAMLNQLYFETNIGTVTTADQLVNNARLFSYMTTAFELKSTTLKSTMTFVLTSDLSDPNSYVNKLTGEDAVKFKALAQQFSFLTDGTLAAGTTAQTTEQTRVTSNAYFSHYNDKDEESDATLVASYQRLIASVDSVDKFMSTTSVYNFALKAFGLDPNTESAFNIRKVLTSDLSDPKSYANSLKDKRYLELAKAYNFQTDGTVGIPVLAQSEAEILNMAKAYVIQKSRFGEEGVADKAEEEAKYYSAEIAKFDNVEDLLSNRRLVDFILTSAGIDPEDVTTDYVRQMFQSDLDDPESFANTETDSRYKAIVSAFNFDMLGNVIRVSDASIQSRRGIIETQDLYLNQTLEEEQGADNAGVRLALYFRRHAEDLTTEFDILADSALLQVIQTAYSLPEEMSGADIDVQAEYIKRVFKVEDMQDPDKVEKLLLRFTSLYDVENNTDVSPVLQLMGGTSGGISADTLMTLSQLRLGGF
ncbi:DUF1217 domain-containing protein [Pararhizobium sp.]|uniref:DUF1217 domain-containing protein n=1 Tax=Pararhizobium sp. TaxID=1977563 RepID=UPI0027181868|nr:DUF1217 domain-containing protein [Pararhizobium sp.]MDO9415704.1 DUF1217 domain-containing protein [Pararhizobium sp.]